MSKTRAGYVALVGAPNAGKSSLLNRLVEQKLSAVSSIPQTTRQQVVGIDTRDGVQMVFVDTPGLLEPRHLFHRTMVDSALSATHDADAVTLVLDGTAPPPAFGPGVLEALVPHANKSVVAINKSDVAPDARTSGLRDWAEQQLGASVLTVSARTGSGIEELRTTIASHLPESPFLFPEDEIATQSVRFFVAELIRESVLELYAREVPHSVAIVIEEFREASRPVYIRSTIFVERASQKSIIIGSGGEAIKRLGAHSRRKIELFTGASVFLDLWVKVLPNWRRKADLLQRLGYHPPPGAA